MLKFVSSDGEWGQRRGPKPVLFVLFYFGAFKNFVFRYAKKAFCENLYV